jgi:AcrR family transcriptional regulator
MEKLPAGRHKLPREVVLNSQRERLVQAMAECCAEKGYAETTIYDIVSRAGVSKRSFYANFENKEECFEAAVDRFLTLVNEVVADARADEGKPWVEMVRDAIRGLLETLAARPELTKLAFLETLAAGPTAYDRYSAGERVLISLFELGREVAPEDLETPPRAARAALGGAQALVVDQLIAERTDRLPDLLPDMLYIALVPYLGQEEALRHANPVGG